MHILSGMVVSIFAAIYFITEKIPIGYIYILAITLSMVAMPLSNMTFRILFDVMPATIIFPI